MKKYSGLIIHYSKISPTTTLASARIAWILQKVTGWPIMDRWDNDSVERYVKGYDKDILVVVSSPYIAAEKAFRDTVPRLAALSKLYVFCVNDYKLSAPGQIGAFFKRIGRTQPKSVWSTIPSWVKTPQDTVINWNRSTWRETGALPFRPRPACAVSYYGAFREGRIQAFRRLFGEGEYPLVISSSVIGSKRFVEAFPHAEMHKPQADIVEWASRFACALYLEDEYSHTAFTSLANRFYECLCSGTAILFDEACLGTFNQSGYSIDDFVVRQARDVPDMLSEYDWIRKRQRKLWARDYYAELMTDIARAFDELVPRAIEHYEENR